MLAKTAANPLPLAACLLAVVLVAAGAQPTADKEKILNELELVEDDGSVDAAVMNYLFAKQIVNRLRQQADVSDLQRKRSYWKQCAFNAVSCFGQKREGYRGKNLVAGRQNQWNIFSKLFSLDK